MWNVALLADRFRDALEQKNTAFRQEQAVFGIDSLSERQIQVLVAEHLANEYEVQREVHYPSCASPKLSDRQRCDLRLFPKGTYEESDSAVRSRDASLWVEMKVAYQYREGGMRNRQYNAQWRVHIAEDVRKIESDRLICDAVIALVFFTESVEIAQKDLDLFELVLAEKGVLVGFRHVRHMNIPDRIGHRTCTVALWPMIPNS